MSHYVNLNTWKSQLHLRDYFSKSWYSLSLSTTNLHWMDPEGSLLCSQGTANGPNSIQSKPCHTTTLRSIILAFRPCLGLPTDSYPQFSDYSVLWISHPPTGVITSQSSNSLFAHPYRIYCRAQIWSYFVIQISQPPFSSSSSSSATSPHSCYIRDSYKCMRNKHVLWPH
jgi:hypothetical protein